MASNATLHASRSAERTLDLLEALADAGPAGLTKLARATDIPTSTTLRHLRVLTERRWVERREDDTYVLGPRALRLAIHTETAATWSRLRAQSQHHLQHLAEETGESAYLAVRSGDEALYLATAEGTKTIRHVGWVGRAVPLEGTAVGEALLENEPAGPPHRNLGAVEIDVGAISAAIWLGDRVVAAVSLLGPASRFEPADTHDSEGAVLDTARSIELSLRDSS